MSRFNTATMPRPVRRGDTVNLAGGEAFSQTSELEFASVLLTSMVTDQYYRSANDTLDRVVTLLGQVEPEYAAKAAIFARNEYGMRSISHVVAAEIFGLGLGRGEAWRKRFIEAVVRRPDDMTEIVAYYLSKYGKLPNGLKKGLASAFDKFDGYQLAKYRKADKAVSLVDVVNLVHPVPTDKNRAALKALVADELRSQGTWESKVSQAGTAENKDEAKAEAWRELLSERKIGYFALLRNLRNISEQAPELVPTAAELLVDEGLIRNSLVLPFRYLTALRQVSDTRLVSALSRAVDISLGNVPDLANSLVVIDHSGSMGAPVAGGELERQYVGDVFASALFKKGQGDVMVFGDNAGYVPRLNPDDSTLSLTEQIGSVCHGHGTNFHAIFETANKKYDRIVIFSDMQGWRNYYHPGSSFEEYKQQKRANPFIYSFDLAGYGSMQFPEDRVFALAGFSEKTFELMGILETDRKALVNKIRSVEL